MALIFLHSSGKQQAVRHWYETSCMRCKTGGAGSCRQESHRFKIVSTCSMFHCTQLVSAQTAQRSYPAQNLCIPVIHRSVRHALMFHSTPEQCVDPICLTSEVLTKSVISSSSLSVHGAQRKQCVRGWPTMMPCCIKIHTNQAVKLIKHHQHLPKGVLQLNVFLGELLRLAGAGALPPQAQLVEQIPHQILLVHQLLNVWQTLHMQCTD